MSKIKRIERVEKIKEVEDAEVSATEGNMTEENMIDALTSVSKGEFEFEEIEMEFKKKTLEEIEELSENVDIDKAADEILQWLINNVSQYIDNHQKEFRIELVIDENSNEEMENIKLLQDLYRAIPDDSDIVAPEKIEQIMSSGDLNDAFEDDDFSRLVDCREKLDVLSFDIHDKMRKSDKIKELYKAMIYFYEMVGINEGQPLLKELAGEVDIVEFEYEAFNIGVKVLEGSMGIDSDVNEKCEKSTIKQYVVPEGFSLLLEIAFVDQNRSLGIF